VALPSPAGSPVTSPVRLAGSFDVTYVVLAATNSPDVQVGDSFSRTMTFTPACPSGPCETGKVKVSFAGESYTAHYTWGGASYSFTSPRPPTCVVSGHEVAYGKFQEIYSLLPLGDPSGKVTGFQGLYGVQAYDPGSYQGKSCATPLSLQERIVGVPAGG
jgi:hypothetical protein